MTGILVRMFFRALVPLVIVVGVGFYALYLQGLDPVALLKAPIAQGGMAHRSTGAVGPSQPAGGTRELRTSGSTTTVYRWRGPDGSVQFGDRPPVGAVGLASLEIDPDANLIQGIDVPAPAGGSAASDSSMPAVGNPFSAARVQQLFEQAGLQTRATGPGN